ncbi:ras-related protein Rab-36 [Ochlerotatus camptorhynchus]|uniref:ras-related protein Rab-36 n=1 Tax=Ochlerotatus camptorhynchus TaxID=644619 RepID=UPI0031CF8C3D
MPTFRKPSKKANSYEILNNNVDYGSRTIDRMPRAYCDRASPYRGRVEFGEKTRRACGSVMSFYLCACKAIFVGDVATGKSSLVNRFCHEIFDGDYRGTIGVDFEVEKFHVLSHAYSLQIWDTAGHERFKCISQAYYRNANVIVVVFDLTRAESLMNARRWLDDAMKLNHPGALKFLVGTKKDLLDDHSLLAVEREAETMANDLQAEYWSVSAQTGENVTQLFQRLTALAFDSAVQRLMGPNNPVVHPSGNSLLNLYFLKKDEKDKKLKKCSFCKIN